MMIQLLFRWPARVALLTLVLAGAGCAAAGPMVGDQGGSRGTAVVHGEVRSVDTRSNRIQLREDRGRTQTLRYDGRTRVTYRQRSYPVTALERGDYVTARVVYDRDGRGWVERLEVRESVRDRGRGPVAGRVQRVEGTVQRVDTRRGSFSVAPARGRAVVVNVPHDLGRSDQRRFERLRRGDRVRADVRPLGRGQYELVRFR